MTGDKYLEPGRRARIAVRRFVAPDGSERFKICQGNAVYDGRVGEKFLQEMKWTDEASAQSFLDRLAKIRGWKKV